MERKALEQQVVLYEDNGAVSFSPVVDGKVLDDNEFANMPDAQRQHFFAIVAGLETILNEQLLELPQWKRELSEQLRALKRETIEQAVKPLTKALEHHYADELGILRYLRELKPQLVKAVLELISEELDANTRNSSLNSSSSSCTK